MFEIKTSDLKFVRDTSKTAIEGLLAGSITARDASAIAMQTGRIVQAVSHDLRTRLSMPALLEAEAKLVNASRNDAIDPPRAKAAKPVTAQRKRHGLASR